MIKIIIVKLLKFFKVFEKNRKLNFEIIFMLRSICLHFYNLFLFNKSLVNYLNVSGSDKGIKYIRMYDILPSLIEKKNPTILEIGIGGHSAKYSGGKSLQALMFFFRKGKVIGADIIDKSFLDRSNLETYILDQNNVSQLHRLGKKYKNFDLIIDDGSHFPKHQKKSFEVLFNYLSEGGVYIIEDMKSSYRNGYGGNSNLGKGNIVQFFKDLSHAPNSEMLKNKFLVKIKNYKNIELVCFFKSAILIKKRTKKHKLLTNKELNKSFKSFDKRKTKQGYLKLS
jgi:hypothetical protein